MPDKISWRLILVSLLLVISVFTVLPLQKKISLGLDLKGGMHLIMKVDTSSLTPKQKKGAAQRALEVIRNRIDELGVKEPLIQPQGRDELLIQIPGVVNRERALSIIGKTALLKFELVEENPDIIAAQMKKTSPEYEVLDFKGTKLVLKKKPYITGADLSDAQFNYNSSELSYQVNLTFNKEGAKKFSDITQNNVGKRLAIILDGKVQSAPRIDEPITTGQARIRGNFSLDEARDLALVLRSGALPCPLYVEEERTIGPLLGEDSIRKGLKATAVSGIAVALFMLVYYLFAGFVAVLALVFNLVLILFGLYLLKATLTLPGIAGIILTVGMAVDANVLIFERIREELAVKKPLSLAIKFGYEKAFRTILDSNVTTFIAALCLFAFGTGPIKGFGVTLMLGILASMFTAIVFTRLVFDILLKYKKLKSLPMLSMIKNANINFISKIKVCITLSLLLIIAGAGYFIKGKDSVYGIDFAGGQIQEYQFKKNININKIRQEFKQEGVKDVNIYSFKDRKNIIALRSLKDSFKEVKSVLDKYYPRGYDVLRVEKVGPVVGKLLRKKAVMAVIFALLGILFYVRLRFRHFDFALAAVIALFHDVLIGLFSAVFFSYKINLLIVTALLTIAGYSINDTIVVYDRIREFTPRARKLSLREIINSAINQTLPRTIITSLTTIIAVLGIFLLGPYTLRGFSFTMLVGFVVGTYSSIYIASPLVILFRKKR